MAVGIIITATVLREGVIGLCRLIFMCRVVSLMRLIPVVFCR